MHRPIFILVFSLIVLNSCKEEELTMATPTPACGSSNQTVSDIDGNVYSVVSIGNQCWMRENLRTTRFREGSPIVNLKNDSAWQFTNSPAYVVYNDSALYDSVFGYYYNYYSVVDSRKLCPIGWRVSDIDDWNILLSYLDPASIIDSCYPSCLVSTNLGLTNLSATSNYTLYVDDCPGSDSIQFRALAGGGVSRFRDFEYKGSSSCFWAAENSSSDTSFAMIELFCSGIYRSSYQSKNAGLSVRCIKE